MISDDRNKTEHRERLRVGSEGLAELDTMHNLNEVSTSRNVNPNI